MKKEQDGKQMNNPIKVIFFSFIITLFFLSYISISYAKITVDRGKLMTYGVKFENFQMAVLSNNGDVLIGLEPVEDLKLRKEGKIFKVHVLLMDIKKEEVLSWKSAYVNLTSIKQVILSESGDKLLIIGNNGTSLSVLDTITMKLINIFSHEKDKPGFRAEPIGMYYKGYFYIKGYFYDKEQYTQGDCIAKIDITKTGINALEKTIDFEEIKKNLKGTIASIYMVSPETSFFAVLRTDEKTKVRKQYLIAYYKGKYIEIDSDVSIEDIAGSNSSVIYNISKGNNEQEDKTRIYNLESGKRWDVGSYIAYSFIAHDGKLVIVSEFDFTKIKMSFLYAKESENFIPQKLLDTVEPGAFKLSGDGHIFAYLSSKNLLIDKIK